MSIAIAVAAMAMVAPTLGRESAAPQLPQATFTQPEENPDSADEGHLLIEWDAPEDSPDGHFQLQQASASDFTDARTLYSGPDHGSYVTGLPAGSTYFRVRWVSTEEEKGPWSETLQIEVTFPAYWKVLLLMTGGCLMFIILLVTIIVGARKNREESKTP